MKGFQKERIAARIRRELTQILAEGVSDEDIPPFFIERVELTPDFGVARAFVTSAVAGEKLDEAAVLKPLRKLKPKIRSELIRRVRLRRAPDLVFQVDKGQQHKERIETLLKRIKKRSPPGGAAVLLLTLAGALGSLRAEAPKLERFESQAQVMGTTFRVAAYGENKRRVANVVYSAFDEARRLDRMLSNYREDSELSRINRTAGGRDVKTSAEMAEFLNRCLAYSRETEGAFDITVGRLMETWGFFKGSGELPSERAINRALEQVGYRQMQLSGRTVRFLRPGLQLDPGGVGKGYAAERMAAVMRKYGLQSAMIGAGDSTLYAIGAPPDEPRGWKAEIRSPDNVDNVIETIYLRDESLSTSGSYEKFFTADGVRYSHIMDPRTGRPARGTASVSVRAKSALDSEVWTTALFVLGKDWAERNAPAAPAVFYCEDGSGCSWLPSRQ